MNTESIELPEWKNALEAMRQQGIKYGQTFTVEFFEQHMRLKRDELRFVFGISAIRRELEADGKYLSGKGGRGQTWIIRPVNENAHMMRLYGRKAVDALRRGVILGTSTPLDLLEPEERRRHEQVCERLAHRAILIARADSIPRDLKALAPHK